MAITLGLVEAVDDNGVYVTMPGSRGVLRGPYKSLSTVAAGTTVLVASTDDGEQVVVGPSGGGAGAVSVTAFGAVGDGTTDDTAAIQAAIAAVPAGGRLLFPAVGDGYRTTAAITVPASVYLTMSAPIVYAGAAGVTALTIDGGDESSQNGDYHLAVRRATQADWDNAGDIGIVVRNVQRSTITIARAVGFTIGVRFFADSAEGCVYNNVELVDIHNNKYGVDLYSDDSGWVNENIFRGGAFTVDSSVNLSKSRYGVRIHSGDGYRQNANVFHKPSFEVGGALTGGAEAVPILINDGLLNSFHDIRDEGNSGTAIRTTDDSSLNYVSSTYSSVVENEIDDTGDFPSTVIEPAIWQSYRAERLLFMASAIHKSAVPYDGTQTNVPGFFLGDSSSATTYRQGTGLSIAADYLTLTYRAMGVFVDARQVRRFVLDVCAEPSYGGRVVVRCYDSSGAVLDPAAYADPLIRGNEGRQLSSTTDWGGAYITGSDSTDGRPVYFAVTHTDVDHIAVMAASGTADLRISSFCLRTPQAGGQASVWTPFPENAVLPVATQAPASGTWNAGQVVYHGAPSSGNPMGWVCTTGGSPGTWKALANVS